MLRNWGKRKKEIFAQAAKTTKAGIQARKVVTALNRRHQSLFISGKREPGLAHHLAVKVVGGAKPFLEVVVDLIAARDLDAMGDAVFFSEAAGVDEPLRQPTAIRREAKSEIDSRVGRGLNLREDMITVKR